MLEPVVAIVMAWAPLSGSLGPTEPSGAARTLLGILLGPDSAVKSPLLAKSIYPFWGRRPPERDLQTPANAD